MRRKKIDWGEFVRVWGTLFAVFLFVVFGAAINMFIFAAFWKYVFGS